MRTRPLAIRFGNRRPRFRAGRGALIAVLCVAMAGRGFAAEGDRLTEVLLKPDGVEMKEMLEVMAAADSGDIKLMMVFPRACRMAQMSDLPALVEIFSRCSSKPYTQGKIFPALAAACCG